MISPHYKGWIWAVAIALDQLGNALVGGHPDITVSSRIGYGYTAQKRPLWWWNLNRAAVDWAFKPLEPQHCIDSYHAETTTDKVRRGNDVGLFGLTVLALVFAPVLGVLIRIRQLLKGVFDG